MQVYRRMDIGTAKPSPAEQAAVPHHLIDLVDPADPFTVAEFQSAGREVLDRLAAAGTPVMIVGGSGLHFRALVDPLHFEPTDPEVRAEIERLGPVEAIEQLVDVDAGAGNHVDLANPRRVVRAIEIYRLTGMTPSARASGEDAAAVREYCSIMPIAAVGLDPGERLRGRVHRRLDAMMEEGFLQEVRLLAAELGPTASQAVGYRQLLEVVAGEWELAEGVRRARDATTALARRQRTFFRRDPRIRWLEWDDDGERQAETALRTLEEAGWTS